MTLLFYLYYIYFNFKLKMLLFQQNKVHMVSSIVYLKKYIKFFYCAKSYE
jgi:hypothetical protein